MDVANREVYLRRIESLPFELWELEFPDGLKARSRATPVDGRFLIELARYHPGEEAIFIPKKIADYPVRAQELLREVLIEEVRIGGYKLAESRTVYSEVH